MIENNNIIEDLSTLCTELSDCQVLPIESEETDQAGQSGMKKKQPYKDRKLEHKLYKYECMAKKNDGVSRVSSASQVS